MTQFARRTNFWQGDSNALDKALNAVETPQHVCDLTQSNPAKTGIKYPSHWPQALSQSGVLSYDPQSFGLPQAREAIAQYYQRRGYKVDAKRIVLTASSSESYGHLLRLLINPHEKVLIPTPSYPLFPYLLDIHDAAYDTYALNSEAHWSIDRDDLLSKLDATVKMIMLVAPNNPTGSYINADDMRWLSDLAAKHGIALVADEVFMDYAFDQGGTSFLNTNGCLTFVIGGLSKTLCLPGMKLGWLIACGPKELVEGALERLEIISDTYLSVNTPVQMAAPIWLKDVDAVQEQIKERLKTNLQFAHAHCPPKATLLDPQGGWYLIVRLPDAIDDEQFCLQAIDHGVLLYPGYFFDMPGDNYVIVSLLTAEDIFAKGWEKLCHCEERFL